MVTSVGFSEATPHSTQFYGAQESVFELTLHEPDMLVKNVPETVVQDLWLGQRFHPSTLATTSGQPVCVLNPGILNTDAGPDFVGAHVRIGDVEWTGDIEIHVTSSGWFTHHHHLDTTYNNVILHVALQSDLWTGGLLREDSSPLPELILYPHLENPLRHHLYRFYTQDQNKIICSPSWHQVPVEIKQSWIEQLADERIQQKQNLLATEYLSTPDLAELLYERMFAGLGYAKNQKAMTTLAHRVPLAISRQFGNPLDLEALYLGVSGLLPKPGDLLQSDRATADHVMDMRDRFVRIQLELDFPVMDRDAWHYFRLRPANFPPLRVAQGAAISRQLLNRNPIETLLRVISDINPLAALKRTLRVSPDSFWETHVRLEKSCKPHNAAIGKERCLNLIVNAVVPVLLLYARQENDKPLENVILDLMRLIPAEKDSITRIFGRLGFRPRSAFIAQGLHQLYRTRCSEAHCLTCPIGQHILDHS